jgi:hypothetical protein
MNMQFFFFFNETKCVEVSHTPKLNLYIVPNVYYMKRADLGFGELSGLAWLIAHPQT